MVQTRPAWLKILCDLESRVSLEPLGWIGEDLGVWRASWGSLGLLLG